MKIVIAIEGIDGAGKSSLARYIEAFCTQNGEQCTRVGRHTHYVSRVVSRLTHLLASEAANLAPQADIYARLAREYQRALLAAAAPGRVIVISRFVLSILAQARLAWESPDHLVRPLREIAEAADLHATVFVRCPVETAWERVRQRHPRAAFHSGMKEHLQKIAGHMEEDFRKGAITGRQWVVDNSRSLAEGQEQIQEYLQPYLRTDES